MTLRNFMLTAVALAGAVLALPQTAEARVVVNYYNGPTTYSTPCQDYTRTFIDGNGYQRTAIGTSCLQQNGNWVVVSENLQPLPRPTGIVYSNVSIYSPPAQVIIGQPYYRQPYYNGHDRRGHYDGRDDHGRGHWNR